MSVICIISEKPNEKNSKVFILGLKLIWFPYFGHNKNFPWKSKALTFAKFLIPVIWNNFRNVLSKFTEKFESVNSGAPKCPHFSHFEHDKNFPCKKSFVTFSCLLNPSFMQKIREKDKYLNHSQNSWLQNDLFKDVFRVASGESNKFRSRACNRFLRISLRVFWEKFSMPRRDNSWIGGDTNVTWKAQEETNFIWKYHQSKYNFCRSSLVFKSCDEWLFLQFLWWHEGIFWYMCPDTVCNFQSMKSSVELNSLLSKLFCYITWFVNHLIRRNTGRLVNEAFTSNPIVSSKQ